MTVDLLPHPSTRAFPRLAPAVDRVPAAQPRDGHDLWTQGGHDCPYCCGPETD